MKIDEREMQKNNSNNKNGQRQKRTSGLESIVKGWDKPFCCAFKLGLLQLICKAFLIFKSNLELALSIILKGRELYIFLNSSFQMTSFANIARTIASTSNLYTRKDFKSSGIASIKTVFNFEWSKN